MTRERTLSHFEIDFIREALKSAKLEIEELEYELDWYCSGVPEELEQALEILREPEAK